MAEILFRGGLRGQGERFSQRFRSGRQNPERPRHSIDLGMSRVAVDEVVSSARLATIGQESEGIHMELRQAPGHTNGPRPSRSARPDPNGRNGRRSGTAWENLVGGIAVLLLCAVGWWLAQSHGRPEAPSVASCAARGSSAVPPTTSANRDASSQAVNSDALAPSDVSRDISKAPSEPARGAAPVTVPSAESPPVPPSLQSAAPVPPPRFVGSSQSNKYHRSSCEWAGRINPENEVWFASPEDAQSQGYLPCRVCRPR